MKATVVIPAYNEAGTITDVARRTLEQDVDLIIVDDASADDTATQLQGMSLTLLRHQINSGKGASLWHGMQTALAQGAAVIITLDGDGQHRPEDIPRLLEMSIRHPDNIIIAARCLVTHDAPRLRRFANRFADFWISWAAGYPIKDSQSGFRLYPAKLLRNIEIDVGRDRGFVFESEMLIKAAHAGVFSTIVPIAALYKTTSRASHFRPVKDIAAITRMVAGYLLRNYLAPGNLLRALRVLPHPARQSASRKLP